MSGKAGGALSESLLLIEMEGKAIRDRAKQGASGFIIEINEMKYVSD